MTFEELIKETIEHYSVHPRSILNEAVHPPDIATCLYKSVCSTTGVDTACGVGRCLTPVHQERFHKTYDATDNSWIRTIYELEGKGNPYFMDNFVDSKYAGFSITQWATIQGIHDGESYWDSDKRFNMSGVDSILAHLCCDTSNPEKLKSDHFMSEAHLAEFLPEYVLKEFFGNDTHEAATRIQRYRKGKKA